jgi:glutamate/tyrosine decarboxylase-like PLP-dependent enzyme
MVDPLYETAEIAEKAGAWFHVDAAWGGAAIASEQARTALAGIELADSVTIDAHKWLATTMACGMFITAGPEILSKSFGISASFMPSSIGSEDPYMTSIMWSRRFLGLRLFMNLAAAGWQGYGNHIDNTLRMTRYIREQLEAAGWSVLNPGSLGVICVVPPPGYRPVQVISSELVSSGQAWVSAASFEGQDVIRICVTNGNTEQKDADALIACLSFFGDVTPLQHVPSN